MLALEAQLDEVETQLADVKKTLREREKELSVPRNQLRQKAFEASDVEHLVRELQAGGVS